MKKKGSIEDLEGKIQEMELRIKEQEGVSDEIKHKIKANNMKLIQGSS